MAHLTLAGMSEDKRRLLLVDGSGTEHTLDVNQALRAAVRGDAASLGQLEIHMDSALRPRDIQTRIRAGESPESVAQAAGVPVERIMPFAEPVLAERAHIADRAQRASVRRRSGETGARTLGEAVLAQLGPLNVPTSSVTWDAARREDGRWSLTADYAAGPRTGPAVFAFDAPGNFVIAENDEARWLVGEGGEEAEPTARDDLASARQRRLAPAPADELPLGEDAISLVSDPPLPAAVPADSPHPATAAEASFLDEVFTAQNPEQEPVDGASPVESEAEAAAEEEVEHPDPPRRQVKKSRGRASVPSWEEIMFGGKSD